jgi:SAM-dependent methyltransferase
MTGISDRPAQQPAGPYPMDNATAASARQHRALAELLDGHTTRRISGLLDLVGATCLEVGAGGGSIAVWLADRVGPHGRVVALDLQPGQIPSRPCLEVSRHDLAHDPLPGGPFDLVHARLTLLHLPQRHTILRDLVGVLALGGWLLIEDWDASDVHTLVCAPDEASGALYRRYQKLVGEKVFAAAGTDRAWARDLHPLLLAEGLVEVTTRVEFEYWTGGGPGLAGLVGSNLVQLRERLLAVGLRASELERLAVLVGDERLVVRGFPMHSTAGRRPGPATGPAGGGRLTQRRPHRRGPAGTAAEVSGGG